MVIAALDKCIGSRFGLGGKIDEALGTIGTMCIPMTGMILLAPVIGSVLQSPVSKIFSFFGADPAIFAGMILSCDMGGYPLALSMAQDPQAGAISGCILGCSFGSVVSFIIPVGITMVKEDNLPYFATGVLIGVITIPIGMFAGVLIMGCSMSMMFPNILPVLLASTVIALGLRYAQSITIHIFCIFGKILSAISVIGFAIGIAQELTPVVILPGIPSVLDGIRIVGSVAIVLCGAYPMLEMANRFFGKKIKKLGNLMGADQVATTAIIGGLANIMPVLGTCNRMSPTGIMIAMAFSVSASCLLGDHLGFITSVDKAMIVPVIISKIVGGVTATLLAVYIGKKDNHALSTLSEKVGD